jgi:hypothetical protein
MQLEVTDVGVSVGENVYPLGKELGGLAKVSGVDAPLIVGETV